VLNSGRGTLNFSVGSDVNWLQAGKAPCPIRAVSSVSPVPEVVVQIRIGNMAPGNYEGHIQVSAPEAENPSQLVTVKLTVLPQGSSPGPIVRPTGLVFTGPRGQTPGSLDLYIYNFTSSLFHFNSNSVTVDGGKWFTYTPSAGDVRPRGDPPVFRV